MSNYNKQELDKTVKKIIEKHTGCSYKILLKYSRYIKGLLISTKDNCLTNINSKNLINRDFSCIYRDITYKKDEEVNGLTEQCIKRKQIINDNYNKEKKNEEILNKNELLKKIDLYFEMLFVYEILWCLEFVKDDDSILTEEQEEIYIYLSGVAQMYLDLTDEMVNEIIKYNENESTKKLIK